MKLLRYKVTNFRSVEDSGWIECDDVTTLVGINDLVNQTYCLHYGNFTL